MTKRKAKQYRGNALRVQTTSAYKPSTGLEHEYEHALGSRSFFFLRIGRRISTYAQPHCSGHAAFQLGTYTHVLH